MGIVDDLEDRLSSCKAIRNQVDDDWQDYVRLIGPQMSSQFDVGDILTGDAQAQKTPATDRSKEIYDTTAVYMSDRLCSGMESLVSPQSDKWHGLKADDPFAGDPTNEEEEWFDKARDYLFDIRYGGKSGFSLANKKAIQSAVRIGTGCFYVEENQNVSDIRQPVFYRYLPMAEVYLIINHAGEDVGFFREYVLTADQAYTKFNGNVSDKVSRAASNPRWKDNNIYFCACML